MEVEYGPNSVDEPNLLYKLQRKIKVFNSGNPLANRGYNLVASSSKFGLVFIASPDATLSVYRLKDLVDNENNIPHMNIKLQEVPTHIAVSCHHELLAVIGGQLLCIYQISSFRDQDISPSLTVKFDVSPSTFVSALQWNPVIPDSIAIAYYDGSLIAYQAGTGQTKKVPSKARCICWSPKGKQLVTGNSDGTLSQYKPDLTPAKTIPVPSLFDRAPVEALAIYWISTFQFAVVYRNASTNTRPIVAIVNTPKAGKALCLNYDDVCYSVGTNRPWYYYLFGVPQWNLILASSSNSIEIATIGSTDGSSWAQWSQSDEARPELPLTDRKQENYPIGICIDTCGIHQIPWGENDVLPHMPMLHVLSHTGMLSIFNIINIKKGAEQITITPQMLDLPAAALTISIPDDAPEQVAAPPIQQPQPVQAQPPSNQFSTMSASAISVPSYPFPQGNQGFAATPATQTEQKPIEVPAVQPQVQNIPTPVAAPVQPPKIVEDPAVKAERERIANMIANQELKNVLIKEVNVFQTELHQFICSTRVMQKEYQEDINKMHSLFRTIALDKDKLKKECSLEHIRDTIVQLKLELVRACAVVAEARTHYHNNDFNEWTQVDPLTSKRIASVKKLAYYVQTQLDQAQKALDHKWNQLSYRDNKFEKPGSRMIRPILDDIYQPLVKQQEILSRQQAVLRTLKKTLNECDITPVFKSTSILRSTPLRTKDPLSKLTKNILNMSIDPQKQPKESLLTPQKLEMLRDMLSNHQTIKIKPINVEERHKLYTLKQTYDKLKEKVSAEHTDILQQVEMKPPQQTQMKSEFKPFADPPKFVPNVEPKPDPKPEPFKQPITVPSFTPVVNTKPSAPGLFNVARTLFTDEPKQEPAKPLFQQQPFVKAQSAFTFTPPTPTQQEPVDTKSVLKNLLLKEPAKPDVKKATDTFMGQKICSPVNLFSQNTTPTSVAAQSSVFTAKPIADMHNMFTKYQPVSPIPEAKSQTETRKPKSNETGEPEANVEVKAEVNKPKIEKPTTNLFEVKSLAFGSGSDVFKSNTQETVAKTQTKVVAKPIEKSKENIPEKPVDGEKKEPTAIKPFGVPTNTQTSLFNIATQPSSTIISDPDLPKKSAAETNIETTKKTDNKIDGISLLLTASSGSPDANTTSPTISKTHAVFGPPASPTPDQSPKLDEPARSETKPSDLSKLSASTSSASSIFGAAVASQPKTTVQTGSIFTSSTPSSVFGTSQKPIFGTSTSTSSAFSATKDSTTTASESKPSIFGSTSSTSSIFGQAQSTQSVFGATTASVFNTAASTQAPALGTNTVTSTASGGGLDLTKTTQPVFGTPATTAQSIFGTAATASPTSIFGNANTEQKSVFGTATSSSSTSIFGSTTPTTSQPSIFGSAASTASVFGTPTQTSQTSVFGTPTQSTQASVFGTPTQTTQASVFGTPTQTTQASVFGTPTQTSQASVFGTPTQTTQASVFGTPTQTTQASVFGTPTETTQASVFGTPTQTAQASIFGNSTQPTQNSIFGAAPATTTQSGSLFGGAEANLFASASISTTSAPSQSTPGNIFGGSSGSVFGGQNTNAFGGKATFGQSSTATSSIFGSSATPVKPANNFWTGGNNNANNTTGGFGSTGFGQQQTSQASSIFGNTSGGSFSSPSGQAFGSPQPSGVQSGSVFGSPQQTAPAFGGSPVFGSKPAFGQSAGFGSSPSSGFGSFGGFNKSPGGGFGAPATFGGAPTFGSSAFGGASPSGGTFGQSPGGSFGSTAPSNPTFESLGSQNTGISFGNLAQTAQQQQPAQSFKTSPSFTEWRS